MLAKLVCPKFLAERELAGAAAQFRSIMDSWESPIAYFWTWGRYDVAADNYDYLLPSEFCNNNELSLYQKWQTCSGARTMFPRHLTPAYTTSQIYHHRAFPAGQRVNHFYFSH